MDNKFSWNGIYLKNCDVKYLLCVIDVFTKDAWVKPLKNKNGKTIISGFVKIINKYKKSKPNKLCINDEKEFYNNLMQKWLDNNDVLMYSTHSESKSVVAAKFISNLKGKIYKNDS